MESSPKPASPPSLPPEGTPPPAGGEPPGFLQRLLAARASTAFLVAVAAVYLLCLHDSEWDPRWIDPAVAERYGAYDYGRVRDQGEWWRLFTTLFVSRASLSALIYVFIFLQLGPATEKALGTLRFLVLYLAAGAGAVAFAEVVDPDVRLVGTITPVYALLGASPGVVWARTGSVREMARNPEAQSSFFWIGLSLLLVWFLFPNGVFDVTSSLSAAAFGLLLGAGLALTRTRPGAGAAVSAAVLLAVGASVGLAASGTAWRDGGLGDRGVPATGRLPGPGGGDPLTSRTSSSAPEDPGALLEEARQEVRPFLERFGPLPRSTYPGERGPEPTLDAEDESRARELLEYLEGVEERLMAAGDAGLALDGMRVKLQLLLGDRSRSRAVMNRANEYARWAPSPQALALTGVAYLQAGERAIARDRLSEALDAPGMERQIPEAIYYLGMLAVKARAPRRAERQFARFLDVVGEDPSAQPPWRRPLVEQALVQLDRR